MWEHQRRQHLNAMEDDLKKPPKSRGVAFLGSPRAKKVRRKFHKESTTYNDQSSTEMTSISQLSYPL